MRNITIRLAVANPANVWLDRTGAEPKLVLQGDWLVGEAARMDEALTSLDVAGISQLAIDGSKIDRLDSAGAWLILRTRRRMETKGISVREVLLPANYRALYQRLENETPAPAAPHPRRRTFSDFLEQVGRGTMHVF
ncbi:MAG TPA: STAS domain-containing protein, partial [Pseudolabrys sp.]|nr:STAS domain-containing protein [Pseudolabrys sp.]